jgi:8-oxo-dGTP diphosphatase
VNAGAGFRLVVAAVVEAGDGTVLVTRRLPGSHMAGLWEFPGGGVDVGETAEAALERELAEELGVASEVGAPLTFAWHHDSDRSLLLLFYHAAIRGTPRGLQGQEVSWVPAASLHDLAMPPADAALVRMLQGRQEAKGKRQ